MRLCFFEHCSLCFRVRMVVALKRMHAMMDRVGYQPLPAV
jgi:glutaredoxin 2